jgi:septal ring factor EnvC (AmiA/AmiB activator)
MIAAWLVAIAVATILVLHLPAALASPTRAREATRLQTQLASLREQQQTLVGQTASVQSALATERPKVSALTRDTKAKAHRIRDLRSRVASLNRRLGALKS